MFHFGIFPYGKTHKGCRLEPKFASFLGFVSPINVPSLIPLMAEGCVHNGQLYPCMSGRRGCRQWSFCALKMRTQSLGLITVAYKACVVLNVTRYVFHSMCYTLRLLEPSTGTSIYMVQCLRPHTTYCGAHPHSMANAIWVASVQDLA